LAAVLFKLGTVESLLLGAVLASVDPVLLRDVVGDERIPRSIRRALSTEAGTNDIVVLPIVLVLATLAQGKMGGAADWLSLVVKLFLLGPLAGVVIAAVTARLMTLARSYTAISREYRALYGVGVMIAAYVGGEAVGGSGFVAVFAAGFTTVVLDYDLCDCFLDYGETTSEMAMLLAFLLFGALLSTLLGTVPLLTALIFALLILAVVRPVAINLVLWRASISMRARAFIGWFGPRGLSSLLFALLLVTNGVPGAESLLALAGVVVLVSVVVHGLSAAPLANRYAQAVAKETLAEEREGTAAGLFQEDAREVPRVSVEELAAQLAGADPPLVLDVRSRSSYDRERVAIPGSVRVVPEDVEKWAAGQPQYRSIVTYCT
jgi:sodium/hydrogen antiporter